MNKLLLALGAVAIGSVFAVVGCSTGDDDASSPTAESGEDLALSKCHGGLPNFCKICDDGSEQCAHWAIKNGVCQIQTCEVTSAAQCTGILPHFCKICDDGSESCAHWGVKNGVCQIQTCEVKTASQCTGALPHFCKACDDGTSACAHWAVKDGACQIETCPAAPPPPAPAPEPECTKASDCHGALPQLARLCDDGSLGSAHFVCKNAKCEIEMCPTN